MADPRRKDAALLFAAGAAGAAVARALGVSRATASRWKRAWRTDAGLFVRGRVAGRPSRITHAQQQRLSAALAESPRSHGFALDHWSADAIVLLVERQTGVRYHPHHIGRLLYRAGWVLPPHGKHRTHALRRVALRDPEGNLCMLQEHRA